MSEKIKAAVYRMRQRIARDGDIEIVTDAAEAALPPEPKDHVLVCHDATANVAFLFDGLDGMFMTEERAGYYAASWGKKFPHVRYTPTRLRPADPPVSHTIYSDSAQPMTGATPPPSDAGTPRTPFFPGVGL